MDFVRHILARIIIAVATTWGCLTAKKMGTLTFRDDDDEELQLPVYVSDAYFWGSLGSEHDVGIIVDGTLFRRSLAIYTNYHFWQVFDAEEYAAVLAYIFHLSFSFDDDDMEMQYDYGVELHRLYEADMWIITRVDLGRRRIIINKLKELPYKNSGEELHPVPGINPAKYDIRIRRIQQYMQEYPEIVQPQIYFQPVR